MNAVRYRRNIDIPAEWKGKRILLHIERCEAVADTANSAVILSVESSEQALGAIVKATAYFDGREVGKAETKILDRRR